jgi:hypothetical protein
MFFKREKNKFERIRDEIKELIGAGDFESAIGKFASFSDAFNGLRADRRAKFQGDYEIIRDGLILYLKLEEFEVFIGGNEVDKFREGLLYMEEELKRLGRVDNRLLNYVRERYNHYLGIYYVMLHKREFDDNLQRLYYFLENKEYGKALELFPDLFRAFEDISLSANIDKGLYENLVRLKKEIEMKMLKEKAYGRVAEVDTKWLRRRLKIKEKIDIEDKDDVKFYLK